MQCTQSIFPTFPQALWDQGILREQEKENFSSCHPHSANATFSSAEPSLSLQIPNPKFQPLPHISITRITLKQQMLWNIEVSFYIPIVEEHNNVN